MGRKLFLACVLLFLLAGCAAGDVPGQADTSMESSAQAVELTQEEAVKTVRELLIENSEKLCTTQENLNMLRQSDFVCQGEVTVEEQPCWQVAKGSTVFAITKDGEHLYEWQPVTNSFALID